MDKLDKIVSTNTLDQHNVAAIYINQESPQESHDAEYSYREEETYPQNVDNMNGITMIMSQDRKG
jgi:hypothetical protein